MVHPQTHIDFEGALTDGRLVEADEELAYAAGFRIPVAYSQACYRQFVQWPQRGKSGQDEKGRAWDVLLLAALFLHQGANEFGIARFPIYCVPPGGDSPIESALQVAFLGDSVWDEPCVVVMLASESTAEIHEKGGQSTHEQ